MKKAPPVPLTGADPVLEKAAFGRGSRPHPVRALTALIQSGGKAPARRGSESPPSLVKQSKQATVPYGNHVPPGHSGAAQRLVH